MNLATRIRFRIRHLVLLAVVSCVIAAGYRAFTRVVSLETDHTNFLNIKISSTVTCFAITSVEQCEQLAQDFDEIQIIDFMIKEMHVSAPNATRAVQEASIVTGRNGVFFWVSIHLPAWGHRQVSIRNLKIDFSHDDPEAQRMNRAAIVAYLKWVDEFDNNDVRIRTHYNLGAIPDQRLLSQLSLTLSDPEYRESDEQSATKLEN